MKAENRQEETTPEERLALIEKMINQAKNKFNGGSFYFLLWGWLLILAGLSEFTLDFLIDVPQQFVYLGWPAIGILGGIISGVKGSKDHKKEEAKHYMDRIFGFVWGGFGAALFLIIVVSISFVPEQTNSYVLLLTGLPTFITGGVMRFKPLIIGGVLFWLFSLSSFFLWTEYNALIFAAAILFGYLVPGYLLKQTENEV